MNGFERHSEKLATLVFICERKNVPIDIVRFIAQFVKIDLTGNNQVFVCEDGKLMTDYKITRYKNRDWSWENGKGNVLWSCRHCYGPMLNYRFGSICLRNGVSCKRFKGPIRYDVVFPPPPPSFDGGVWGTWNSF